MVRRIFSDVKDFDLKWLFLMRPWQTVVSFRSQSSHRNSERYINFKYISLIKYIHRKTDKTFDFVPLPGHNRFILARRV